jgi:hypothetical protein
MAKPPSGGFFIYLCLKNVDKHETNSHFYNMNKFFFHEILLK